MDTYLGKTTLKVRRIGFGGIPIQRLGLEESDRLIRRAVDLGINFFDTSRIYTDSEEKLGRVFHSCRDKVVIASKSYSRGGAEVSIDIETSLKALQTDYIDVMQCHNVASVNDLQQILAPNGALEALQKAQKAGKIRYIGISGHKPPVLIEALRQFDFATLQVPLNLVETGALDELIPLAKEKQIGVIAMKPMAGGAVQNVGLNLRFILTHGADVAIPGMDAENQVKENLSVLDNLAPLTGEEEAILDRERQELGESFCRRCEYCMPCPEGLPISFLHVLNAYYFRYNLKDWAWQRIDSLPKSFKDCVACGQCVSRCPYNLDNPVIFKTAWEEILADRHSPN